MLKVQCLSYLYIFFYITTELTLELARSALQEINVLFIIQVDVMFMIKRINESNILSAFFKNEYAESKQQFTLQGFSYESPKV